MRTYWCLILTVFGLQFLPWKCKGQSAFQYDSSGNLTNVAPVVAGPPLISSSPQNIEVFSGGDAGFGVTASGPEPITYQWSKNSVSLPGATNSALFIAGVSSSTIGAYSVVVCNPYGCVTSGAAAQFQLITKIWVGSASGTWQDPTSWAPIGVPTDADYVSIPAGSAISLAGAVTFGGNLTLNGGTINGSPLTLTSNAVVNLTGQISLYSQINNGGTLNMSGAGSLVLYNDSLYGWSGAVVNQSGGLFNLSNDQTIGNVTGYPNNGFINNAGIFTKVTGTNTTIAVTFNNTGLVKLQSGSLTLNNGGTSSAGSTILGGGNVIGGSGMLTLSGGVTLSNVVLELELAGASTVSGVFSWVGGGLYPGSTLTIASNAILYFSGTNTIGLSGVLNNFGAVDWSGTGNLQIFNYAPYGWTGAIINQTGGVFRSSNDQAITNGTYGNGYFNNFGTLLKTDGTNTIFSVTLNNTGLVNIQSGSLTLNNGATGTVGSAFVGQGTNAIAGSGTLTLNGGVILSNLLLEVELAGNSTVSGAFSWASGGLFPGSTLTIASNSILNVNGSNTLGFSGLLNNEGTVNWSGTGNLQINNYSPYGWTGAISNQFGAIFNVSNDQIITNGNPGNGNFNNAGTFLKSAGTNTTLTVALNNSGLVNLESGSLTLNAGGVATGGASIVGQGTNAIVGSGTLTLNGGVILSNLLVNLELAGNSTVSGSFSWVGGGLFPGSTLTIASNSTLNFNGSNTLGLSGLLNNEGTVNWSGTGNLQIYNYSPYGWTGSISNKSGAVFNVSNDQILTNGNPGGGSFINSGTFLKSAGTNTTLTVALNNTGLVNMQNGSLTLNTGSTFSGGSIVVGNGTNAFAGSGILTLSGGVVFSNMLLEVEVAGNSTVSGSFGWASGGLYPGSALTVSSNAVLNLNGSNSLGLSGVLSNYGTINWSGNGNLQLNNYSPYGWSGAILNQAGGLFNVSNDQSISNGNPGNGYFNNNGTFLKSRGTNTTIAVAFNNTGLVDIENGVTLMQATYNGTGGTIGFGLAGKYSFGQMGFSSGPALASIGKLQAYLVGDYVPSDGDGFSLLTYPSESGSLSSVALPQQVQWDNIYSPTAFIIVALSANSTNNTYTWTGAASSDWFNPTNWSPSVVPTGSANQIINFTNGLVNLSSPITINGELNWLGGTLTGNPITIGQTGSLNLGGTGTKYLQNILTNEGAVIWAGGNIVVSNCSPIPEVIVNLGGGTWSIWCDQMMSSSCAGTNAFLDNRGTITKLAGGGTSSIGLPLYNNGGGIVVQQGAVSINAPASLNGVAISGSGSVIFNNGLVNSRAFAINGSTVTLNGPWTNFATVQAINAVLNLGGTFSTSAMGTLNTTGGIVNVVGTLDNRGTNLPIGASSQWMLNGGAINGGSLSSTNGGVLVVNGNASILNGVTFNGSMDVGSSFNGVNLTITNGMVLNGVINVGNPYNSSYGALSFAGTQLLGGTGTVVFGDNATYSENAIREIVAAGTLTIGPQITIEGQDGVIGYSSAWGGPQNVSVVNQGNILENIASGLITISGLSFTNQGVINAPIGTINVTGTYYTSGGSLWVGIGGLSNYGQINFSGRVSLSDSLGVTLNNGYLPVVGSTFPILTYGSETGSFLTYNLPYSSPPLQVAYGSGSLTVTPTQHLVPIVNLTTPANGALYLTPGNISLNATATSSLGEIVRVDFFQGNILIGAVSNFPYGFTWSGATPGFYTMTARATDSTGATAVSSGKSLQVLAGVQGTNFIWVGSQSSDWFTPGNWSPVGIPGALDEATVNGGTVSVSKSTTVGLVNLTSGTISGPGLLSTTSGFIWDGGSLSCPVLIQTNASLFIDNSSTLNLYSPLTNGGTVNWLGTANLSINNNLYVGTSGGIVNLPGAVFNAQNDQAVLNGNGSPYFNNAGTFIKSAGTNSIIGISFNNSGRVLLQSGGIAFNGNVSGVNGAMFTGSRTNVLGGSGVLTLAGGVTLSNVVLAVAGIGGNGTVFGSFNWISGTLNPSSSLTLGVGGVMNLNGSGPIYLDGPLTNAGTINWEGTGGLSMNNNPYVGTSGGIVNLIGALFNVKNNQSMLVSNGNPYFNNAGTFIKSAGTNTTIVVSFNNSGVVNLQSGGIAFNGNASGTSGATFTGTGTNMLGGSGMLTFTGGVTLSNVVLAVAGIGGNGTVYGLFNWNSGTLNPSSSLTLGPGGVMNLNGTVPIYLDSPLTNAGTINWIGAADLSLNNNPYVGTSGGVVNLNGALFNVENDQSMLVANGNPYFSNAGTFVKSAGTNTTVVVGFSNSGLVNLKSGGIALNGNASCSNGAMFTGGGTNVLGGTGTLTMSGSVTLSNLVLAVAGLSGNATVYGDFNWTSGTLNPSSSLTLGVGGIINLSGSSPVYLNGPFTNVGTVNWKGTGNLGINNNSYVGTSGGIVNLAGAVFNIQNDQSIVNVNGSPYFSNAGVIVKWPTFGVTAIAVAFNNNGTVEIDSGTLNLTGPHTLTGGGLIFGLNSGTGFGQMILSGASALAGNLSVTLNGGYIPPLGTSFQILSYSSSSGAFSITNGLTIPSVVVWQSIQGSTGLTIQVKQEVPSITWPTPTPIVFGTPLSGAQLNATANITGVFGYSPTNGVVLNPGTNLLTAVFSPNDTVNYSRATNSVSLVVFSPRPSPTDVPLLPFFGAAALLSGVLILGSQTLSNRNRS